MESIREHNNDLAPGSSWTLNLYSKV